MAECFSIRKGQASLKSTSVRECVSRRKARTILCVPFLMSSFLICACIFNTLKMSMQF